jgi:putative ABC transport system permease protein
VIHAAGLLLVVRRSLREHVVSTTVTALSVSLALGLAMSVFRMDRQTRAAFAGSDVGFDAVLGARGSPLQLVLNAVFHLETSPGNIPWSLYRSVAEDELVAMAVPIAVGDNYRGYRVVGTTEEMFTEFEYRRGRKFTVASGGRRFDPSLREAVVGSVAARRTGLVVGSRFRPYHGLEYDERARHDEEYVVVGVLEPTGTPSDRVVWIPIEGIFRMGGHELRGTGETFTPRPGEVIPDEHREVSAVLLRFAHPQAGRLLQQTVNRQGKVATLAYPIALVMTDLLDRLGWMHRVLRLVSLLVAVVAAASILASLYNTMHERRREFAVLRALGAGRSTVFSAIVLESATVAALGSVGGFLVHGAVMAAAATVLREQTGVVLEVIAFDPVFLWAPAAMTGLGALAGLLPAFKAYSTDVAGSLSGS